jgi:hypothetical protein
VRLTGTVLQQNQKIENLLRLTRGKSEVIQESHVDLPTEHEETA